ncbi:ParA family protein (plasmid) [Borrelia miyamotoi]|uniref:ParA family protein n=1 Tax=Borrelia miyamotoi TaxID=47466 RepID=A0A481YHY5_9SPIR|nr:ParA family protein [Borrelia miyamotoi]ATQ19168.1 ParA family protein [Borrelia miyamotoi]QBK62587.1 ParA family protein [Borrelia miyamotoi]QBK63876.1 ParA family protein [Borrelia miyamotoi]QBK65187.1 ParA family protein [Borrelia miyamotoi]QBK66440.1 ParA family protein [Borrelia miyamotoi]
MDTEKPKIITIASIKGGVGKSTSAIIFATLLAQRYKVLLIDMDTQASSTSYFIDAIEKQKVDIVQYNIYEVVKNNIDVNESIINIHNGLDLIPSYLSLYQFNSETILFKEMRLKENLKLLNIKYDYIILDTNPSLDYTLVNALVVSNYIIVPMTAEKWSVESLQLLEHFIKKAGLKIPIFLIVTRFKTNKTHKYLLKLIELRENFLGFIKEREDLNRKIANNATFDVDKDYIKEYQDIFNKFLGKINIT